MTRLPFGAAVVADGARRLVDQPGNPDGEGQQLLAGRREGDAAARAVEQRHIELAFERANASRDIGLHGIEFLGGAAHPARLRHFLEEF